MRPELLPIVTVFRKPGAGIFHSWCRQPLEYQGRRAELELDFYCHRCLEHVAVPESIVERIPVGVVASGDEALS